MENSGTEASFFEVVHNSDSSGDFIEPREGAVRVSRRSRKATVLNGYVAFAEGPA